MTGWGKSAWASTDPATLMLQFFSDGTFQITGYIHSHCQIKERGGVGWGGGCGVEWALSIFFISVSLCKLFFNLCTSPFVNVCEEDGKYKRWPNS